MSEREVKAPDTQEPVALYTTVAEIYGAKIRKA